MTKQLKTIEILNPSKSATCSMWTYPESAKIFQYRGMDFDGFRVVGVNHSSDRTAAISLNMFMDNNMAQKNALNLKPTFINYSSALYAL